MSISRTRFSTQARTWAIIAGLGALFVGLGGFFGGSNGIILFAGIAVLFNLVMFWYSAKFALKASKARPVDRSEAPELYRDIEEIAGRAGVPMPQVYLIPSEQPNAFATGRNPKNAVVAVTEGLLRYLPRDQVKGVLAHEMAHIANRDILVMTIAAMIGAAIAAIANIMQFSMFFGGGDDDDNPLGIVGVLVAVIVAPLAATILQLAVSRQREYLADATAAQYLGEAKPLADALGTLERGVEAVPMNVNPATEALYIANPLAARASRRSSRRTRRWRSGSAGCTRSTRRTGSTTRRMRRWRLLAAGQAGSRARAAGAACRRPPDEEPALVPAGRGVRSAAAQSRSSSRRSLRTPTPAGASRLGLELAHDGLDVVAVGVEQEGGVVEARLVGAVLLAHAGRAVVAVARSHAGCVKGIDLGARLRDEAHVDRAAPLVAADDDEVRELRPALALPERRDLERLEDRLVEGDARGGVGHRHLDVVEDDPVPIPVDHGRRR